ncbi:MAG: lysophospholipid acyltransferase family protein [Prevotellaceae bacterium]|jgi:KDO2-lipid IV(A) lauroyltransferase|nr:lysophospholipid acyltransferase family protein [Prevotellaceae bacterium]
MNIGEIKYRCIKALLKTLAMLPMCVLYRLADVIYLFAAYVIGYRRKVIDSNLLLVFPEKSEKERRIIRQKYYKHLADLIVEIPATAALSRKQLDKRFVCLNGELLDEYSRQGRHVIVVTGHYSNWEWGLVISDQSSSTPLFVYKRLDSKTSDRYFAEQRARFGAVPVEMEQTMRTAIRYSTQGPVMLVLIADQTPAGGIQNAYFTEFMGVSGTPVFLGPEKIAKHLNAVYIFGDIQKIKRGHYTVKFIVLSENSKSTEQYELTRKYLDCLEHQISAKPEYWMWSHRRWKRRMVN